MTLNYQLCLKSFIVFVLQGGLCSRLLGLFQLMDEQPHFLHLWDRLGPKENIKEFLLNIFYLFNELVSKDVYPSEWAIMGIMANNILLKTMQVLCQLFNPHFPLFLLKLSEKIAISTKFS